MRFEELEVGLKEMGLFDRDWIYFGHPVSLYGLEEEDKIASEIKRAFSVNDFEVFNPNNPICQDGYSHFQKTAGKRGMDFYYEMVLSSPRIKAGVFVPFLDGKFDAGVRGKAEMLYNNGVFIYEYLISESRDHIEAIEKLDSSRFLSVEETRQRIYVDGDRNLGLRDFFTGLPQRDKVI
jgi:hypothetical protein